jgi:multidrug efflux pump subunit AcrA (membrane-fusion protein)
MYPKSIRTVPILLMVAACGTRPAPLAEASLGGGGSGASDLVPVRDSLVAEMVEAAGVAAPFLQATLSTRLMGAVTTVLVHEGDRVRAGQVLVRLDTRDLQAKGEQAQAGLRAAEAEAAEAQRYAVRIRALYADSAAPKAMLDRPRPGLWPGPAGARAGARGRQ